MKPALCVCCTSESAVARFSRLISCACVGALCLPALHPWGHLSFPRRTTWTLQGLMRRPQACRTTPSPRLWVFLGCPRGSTACGRVEHWRRHRHAAPDACPLSSPCRSTLCPARPRCSGRSSWRTSRPTSRTSTSPAVTPLSSSQSGRSTPRCGDDSRARGCGQGLE